MSRNGLVAFLLSVSSLLTPASAGGFNPEAVLPLRPNCVRLCTGPDWLVRYDEASCRTGRFMLLPDHVVGVSGFSVPLLYQTNSGGAQPFGPAASETPESKPAGVGTCALEFGGAVVGTTTAVAGAVGIYSVLAGPDPSNEMLPLVGEGLALSTTLLTSPLLAATGVHFGGKLVGQKGSFWHTLVGGLVGGTVGTAGAYGYIQSWSSSHSYTGTAQSVVEFGCVVIPTALGAVLAYNVWK